MRMADLSIKITQPSLWIVSRLTAVEPNLRLKPQIDKISVVNGVVLLR